MLSVICLTTKAQFGPELFPIAGEQYCAPVIRLFNNDDDKQDLLDENLIIEAHEVYHWIKHHLGGEDKYTNGNFHSFDLQELINKTGVMEVVCDELPKYTGNAKDFVDQLDQVKTEYDDRAISIASVFCYLWPKSVYEELFSRGYKVLLDELFESRISHLYGFLTWCCMVGLPTKNFIILSGRYHAHPHIDTTDVEHQNRDLDFDGMGCNVVNYPAFFWHFESQMQYAISPRPQYEIDWGTNCNFVFPKQALFLNRVERTHRLLAVAYLHKHNKLDDCFWSMRGTNTTNLMNVLNNLPIKLDERFNWFDDQLMESMRCILPRNLEEDSGNNHYVFKEYFANSKFSFVTETVGGSLGQWNAHTSCYPLFSNHLGYFSNENFKLNHRRYGFITEKTFRPIAMGHPFVVMGNNKLLKTLQALGFETYDSVWNEGYNTVIDDVDRFHATMDKVIELIGGFNERAAKKVAEFNKRRFFDQSARSDVLRKWLVEPLLAAYYD